MRVFRETQECIDSFGEVNWGTFMADQKKKIDINQVSKYLQRAFSNAQHKAVQKLGYDNVKGTKLYEYQTNFMYLLDEIQRGPTYIMSMKITEANKLIEMLEKEAR